MFHSKTMQNQFVATKMVLHSYYLWWVKPHRVDLFRFFGQSCKIPAVFNIFSVEVIYWALEVSRDVIPRVCNFRANWCVHNWGDSFPSVSVIYNPKKCLYIPENANENETCITCFDSCDSREISSKIIHPFNYSFIYVYVPDIFRLLSPHVVP